MMTNMMVIGVVLVAGAGWYLLGWIHGRKFERDNGGRKCGARSKDELPEIEPLEEADLIRVGLLGEQDVAVRAPLHVAEGMRVAKRLTMCDALERIRPGVPGQAEQALWMAAGYVSACAEFERLWLEIREKAKLEAGKGNR